VGKPGAQGQCNIGVGNYFCPSDCRGQGPGRPSTCRLSRGGFSPYFSPNTPPDSNAPDGRPFYYTPGETFTFPPPGYEIQLWDDDQNGTLNGWIPVRKTSNFCLNPESTNPPTPSPGTSGCWEERSNGGITTYPGVSGKDIEDPVHIEVASYIGNNMYDPASSRWWFPYRSGSSYDIDPYEPLKQHYRCSEYNPTLPGLDWHKSTLKRYDGADPSGLLRYPNPHPSAQKGCWDGAVRSNMMNVSYTHVSMNGRTWTNRTRLNVTFREDQSVMNNVNIPNPQRIICLTWRGMIGSYVDKWRDDGNLEKTRCWTIIFNIKPRLSLCPTQGWILPWTQGVSLVPDTTKCANLSLFHPTTGPDSVIQVAVGQDFKSYVYFEDVNRDMTQNCSFCDDVKISVVSDPGLPATATLGPVKGPRDQNSAIDAPSREVPVFISGQQSTVSYYQYSRQFSFNPDVLSARKVASENDIGEAAVRNGLKYKVCFFATSTTTTFYPAGTTTLKGDTVCAFLQVVRPEPMLDQVSQLQPYKTDSLEMVSVAGKGAVPLPLMMDTKNNIPLPTFKALVRCPYKFMVVTYDKKDKDIKIPGIRYQTDLIAGYKTGTYAATAKVDPQNPLPKGAMLMKEPGSQYQILSWSPDRGTEGRNYTFCLIITDDKIAEGSHRKCTTIEVLKCQVCGLPSDTLQSISNEYKTDWLQMWGANHEVENPNSLINFIQLKLGPMYKLNADEKTSMLASRFSMTSVGLMEVNPDLQGQDLIKSGTYVCLMPSICAPTE
jgi:hypothetical protein